MLSLLKIYQPNPRFRNLIESYRNYVVKIGTDEKNYMIPEGIIELVIHIQAKTLQTQQTQNDWKNRSEAFVGGLRNKAYEIKSKEKGNLFVIRFKASGFSHFCKFPMNTIKNYLINLQDIWGQEGSDFKEKVIESQNDKERIEVVESFLEQQYIEFKNPRFELITQEINQLPPDISVQELASKFCYSPSRFRHVFNEFIGISPKEYLMIKRINQAFKEKNEVNSLTDLALKLGYFDQAHFIKQCRKITGYNPKAFFEQNLVNNQE